MIKRSAEDRLGEVVAGLARGPSDPDKPYVLSHTSWGRMYAMAAHIRTELGNRPHVAAPRVCLATDDKAIVAAAVIAALAGGPALILPYALTPQVLRELQAVCGYSHAISDGMHPLPEQVTGFQPRPDRAQWPAAGLAAVDPDHQWIHLFTGGSTGTPQIWPKTVRNLLAETIRIVDSYGLNADDWLVSTVSPLHIYGLLYYLLASLVAGAAVTAHTPSFPAEIEAELNLHQAGVLISVPAHYRALRSYQGRGFTVRQAFSSAGVLAAEDAEAFSARTGIGIVEVYGSTETGGAAARIRFKGEEDFTPFDPVDLKIEADDLLVRSDYLSPGLPLDDQGYYPIGDRAEFTVQPRFRLLGRSDNVVKIGGNRVDLEDVRQALKRHARVTEAVVTAQPVGSARENQIVALVEGDVSAEELTALINEMLEPYARPRRIKMVAKIPVTAAGKFDRHTILSFFSDR